MFQTDIKTMAFSGPEAGKNLLVFGGIHGNEVCGTRAIERLARELEDGTLQLKRGQLTMVPVCNPEAHARDVRFIDINLNRIFRHHDHPQAYEEHLANKLVPLVDAHDALLDLHDVPEGDIPFTFLDWETPANAALARALGLPVWITGWPQSFENAPHKADADDTQAYAARKGVTSILVECGQRKSAEADVVAYQSLRRYLHYYDAVDYDDMNDVARPEVYRIERIVWRTQDGTLSKDWQHLDDVVEGELLGTYDDGSQVHAPYSGKMIIPSPNNALGHEWFYLGKPDPAYS